MQAIWSGTPVKGLLDSQIGWDPQFENHWSQVRDGADSKGTHKEMTEIFYISTGVVTTKLHLFAKILLSEHFKKDTFC